MQVEVIRAADVLFEEEESCLVIPVFEKDFPLNSELLQEEDELIFQALADKDVLSGKAEQCHWLPTPGRPYRNAIVAGLGKPEEFEEEALRRAAGVVCTHLKRARVTQCYLDVSHFPDLPVAPFLEGLVLGQYTFEVYKEQKEDVPPPAILERVIVVVDTESDVDMLKLDCAKAVLVGLSTNGARHLANTAPNEMTPAALAAFARGIAEESGCECNVLEEKQMSALGMKALLGVARGSAESPRLIVLRHHYDDDAKTLAMVGKGVTFDSGGISIKPSEGMHEMKFDMCGAAAVLCAMMSLVQIKPPINVICVVPAVENKTGSEAQRPGDIVKACNGKTIEIRNTDAEGRLILADAMAYTIDKYKPDAIVDLATLTGACVVALGHYAAGLMSTDQHLLEALVDAGDITGERLWPLPLWKEYDKLIETPHADICNIGPKGEAGAITAGAFLKAFVGDTPWAHLDIAGTAWGGKHIPYLNPDHATGFGVRLLVEWVLAQCE